MPLRPLRDALGTWSPGRGGAVEPIHAIAAAWTGIVGPDVAANSSPLELSGTALVVTTTSSAWSQQLQMLSLPILRSLRELPELPAIERLTFRAGLIRGRKRRSAPAAAAARARAERRSPAEAGPPPAADAFEALARLRQRIAGIRRTLAGRCSACEAPIDPTAMRCAPCAGEAERERSLRLQRVVYAAPWLALDEICEQLPGTTLAEYERARKVLLQRWWTVLERAKRAGALSRSGVERKLASSYVLLQSRLRPDRVTPAVVKNALGPELHGLLWPER